MTDYISRDDAIAAQPCTMLEPIGAYERGHLKGVMDYARAIRAIPAQPAGDYEALCVRLDGQTLRVTQTIHDDAEKAAAAIRMLLAEIKKLSG